MFKKILVANRGEIACRVMRTAKRMGIATVAVYSDADARAPHVTMADESVRLGPAPAAQSYLDPELILMAAKATGADCIHPGYGFLSERESFARACADAGVAFVGPPPNAIAAMGDKIESKKLAQAAGVNVVPGFLGEIADTEQAVRIATDIGYPVMMKASAGGGGKGMRLAWSEQDVREGFEATKREGLASFGDDRVFIEKFIESPRHIEIQVLGDQHGNIVYLGERECSIQRRHQKVVEEAPSPFVTPAMRKAMGEQAVALARAVGYYSAGTVELIVSGADVTGESFYFLEMNTRLQVEHPVTEEITGLDLVEQMLRVAAGEPLAFTQDDVKLTGWAIENRVYAEDPYRGFLPSTGRLVRYDPPRNGEGDHAKHGGGGAPRTTSLDNAVPRTRVDDGVVEGGEVSMFYDPMIAKLITWAPTREAAIDAQVVALDRFELAGVGNNIDFLSAIMQHPRFRAGALTTGFIAEEYPDGFHGAPADMALLKQLAAVAVLVDLEQSYRSRSIDGQLGTRPAPSTERIVTIGDHRFDICVDGYEGGLLVNIDGDVPLDVVTHWRPSQRLVVARIDDSELAVRVARTIGGWKLTARGASHIVRVLPPHVAALTRHMIEKVPPDLSRFLLCPMPGLLTRVEVAEGQKVEAGQPLAVVEAMKMENILRAERPGTVARIAHAAGNSLAVDAVIMEFE
ncbi:MULTISPECIES: acetyl-CoA carboxylase biotin carboxylase subunit [unclassified Sphingomonas]|uniref:acetyl-CoA carboxylase biotin carboxylase subunit n=1 Tax=unclassified Sphingomonas TaxID=196159 RepID=UPI0006F52230|nr:MULTISPECIES: acetyl/propionyl/methylcrotonyl-CoA carboxylase subunit alpha [unclassified Sphingomonas]KQM66748.1 acetyl/propionyl-CoA carboxylase subuit alpha [Sphingomonas sp. Leaf16]KQN17696.1 acetyl/propionyl-CoA carboxylase subuit alpha [Sphingomonas sp. Leaf29]KQN23559.1 acetyl/propionyl-CoA carboxylase subuit alpha [Sphingomonas sp. Leaf32]